jgi:hypothetical protein
LPGTRHCIGMTSTHVMLVIAFVLAVVSTVLGLV